MSIIFKKKYLGLGLLLLPVMIFAQGPEGLVYGNVSGLLALVTNWLYSFFYILMSVALFVFFWGIVKFISSGGDAKKVEESKKLIVYGIIGLFVMVSIFGLVYLMGNILGIRPGGTVNSPGGGYVSVDGDGDLTGINVQNDYTVDTCIDLADKPLGGLKNISCFIVHYLSFLPPLFLVIALIYFMFGIIQFIRSGNADDKDSAKTAIVYGVLAIFMIVSVWGLVWLLKSALVI